MKVVTAAQMASLEQASEKHGISTDVLMENAGLAVAQAARQLMSGAAGIRVLVLVGPGNNGADGLVAARHLRRWGAEVCAYLVTRRSTPDPKLILAKEYGVTVLDSSDDAGSARLEQLLGHARLVIDAVLGTGRSRPLEGTIKNAMSLLGVRGHDRSRSSLLALDLPTGLDADTGGVDPSCPSADLTVTLGRPKVGLLAFPGAGYAGELKVADIGLPCSMPEEAEIPLELLSSEWARCRLPLKPLDSHKGTFGHALVIAGSRNYVGAAYLAAQAAARAGAGLVTLATPSSVYAIAASKLTEVIHLPLPEDDEGRVNPDAAQIVLAGLDRYDALSIGCGLGWSPGTTGFLKQVLLNLPPALPVVIDADGLNNLSSLDSWWQRLVGPVVVTPHPGEMATLTATSVSEVQKDRIETARHWAGHWNVTVALKGAHTVIAEPGSLVKISPFANPSLASGGTGDVLTGIIVGLLAQGLTPADATGCGVYLHAMAGEAVGLTRGHAGTIASDLIDQLPQALSRLGQESKARA